MAGTGEGTRREHLRAQTLAEIRERALAQVAQGGPEALSLNAIARAMRMSGPALYRYFASREDLLVALVTDSYDDLASALEAALQHTSRAPTGSDRLRAVAAAYRGWATTHPHRYRLVFASSYGSGLLGPDRVLPAATRTMNAMTAAVAQLGGAPQPAAPLRAALPHPLAEQLGRWQQSRVGAAVLSPETLHVSVAAWTRLHGLVSLEIEGVFASMGLDPLLLFEAEVEQLVVTGGGVTAAPGRRRGGAESP